MNWDPEDVIAYCRRTGQPVPEGLEPSRKPGKYHNEPCDIDGHHFDSKKEAGRYCDLRLLEKAGEISALKLQVPFVLAGGVKYIADFTYIEDGKLVVEDVKGGSATKTAVYRIKKRLMAELGYEIKEV